VWSLPAGTWLRGRERRLLTLPKTPSTLLNWTALSMVLIVTVVAIAVPVISPHDPLVPAGMPLQEPGKNGFLLGTDAIGRDILSRLLFGIRASWLAALVVVAVGLLIGGLVGLIAGATGGWVDSLLMRITDTFLSLPAPVLAIAVVAALGPGFVHTLVAGGIAQPLVPSKTSSHQPSIVLNCGTPFSAAFIPLVPDASIGTRGRFSQRSTP